MNTKHTPGPLHVGDGKRVMIVYRADGYAVADCKTFHGRISQDEAEANAVLFAAAPELLEAARYALDCATNKRDGRTLEEMAQRVRDLLTAAIAKATGNA